MRSLFVDTNVALDVISDRRPFSEAGIKLFDYAEKGRVHLFLSALSYSNIYYILRKFTPHREIINVLRDLEALTITADVSKNTVEAALSSDFKDFEDAIQYHAALSIKKIDAIVTRNTKDFRNSRLAILTPAEAVGLIDMEELK